MYQPWVAHMFPGITLLDILVGNWTLHGYLAMADQARGS